MNGFREARRKEKEINLGTAKELLAKSRYGVIAVNGDGGYPYAIPLNYFYDEARNKIYFHGAKAGHKADSIKADPKVCFTVVGEEVYKEEDWAPFTKSVVVFGKCKLIEDRDETISLVRELAMKYYDSVQEVEKEIASSGKAVMMYEIEIEHISGKEIQEK